MKSVVWLLLLVLLAIQFVGQYMWMGQIEEEVQAVRSDVESLRTAVLQLGELMTDDEPEMVMMSK